ncbi:MAG: NADH-quinone oxidoreductase subunit L [Clostridia bacterium]
MDTYFLGTLAFLILFPTVIALILLAVKSDAARGAIVKLSAALLAVGSIVLAVLYFVNGGGVTLAFEGEWVSYAMMVIEVFLMLVIIFLGIKYRHYWACVLAVIQTPLVLWFELTSGHGIEIGYNLYVDGLSVIMALIIGIIGSLIAVYALGYMKDFQHHNEDKPDRRCFFFFIMFVFLAAMFGIVTSNNLIWMYFFWEITSLSSFFLIGYTKTPEAINNSFRALIMNLGGGLGFCFAILFLGKVCGTVELSGLLAGGLSGSWGYYLTIPVACLAFAGITKAAQMPFNSWLLGAMVAPTPVSALLHSSTMVKAGVFLILKLSPLMGVWLPGYAGTYGVLYYNWAGLMVMMVGAITFLLASLAAISQTNAKRVLAYSTIANLGLIVCCGGIGTSAAVWAGIMLIIFHAIAKSLLFLSVGTTEHRIGSRDIEDMDGLFSRLPNVAKFMIIGICGMFIAPFGMLLSKWAAMISFIDSGNPFLILLLVFGSAATLFFWAKWLGKLCAVVAGADDHESIGIPKEEKMVLGTLATLTVAVCLFFPVLSSGVVVPYLSGIFMDVETSMLASGNIIMMSIMVAILILMIAFFFGKTNKRIVPIYLSGENAGDNRTFRNSLKQPQKAELRNWYMNGYFAEKRMNRVGIISTVIVLAIVAVWIGVMAGVAIFTIL